MFFCMADSAFYPCKVDLVVNPLSANPAKWSNTLKQCVGKLSAICFGCVFPFLGLALKVLKVNCLLIVSLHI